MTKPIIKHKTPTEKHRAFIEEKVLDILDILKAINAGKTSRKLNPLFFKMPDQNKNDLYYDQIEYGRKMIKKESKRK